MNCMNRSGRHPRTIVATIAGCIAFAVAVSAPTAMAVNKDPETPKRPSAATHVVAPLARVAERTIPALDMKAIAADDAARERAGEPPRYAIPHPVEITPATDGTWEALDRATSLWRLRISSENAASINLGFTHYHLPDGAYLFLSTPDHEFVIRPFTSADNAPHGELWTPPVPGDALVVELTVPNAVRDDVTLVLGSINVGYRGFHEIGTILSGSCNVDVVCPEGDDWQNEIPAIAVISTGGSTFCSGFMVNNVRNDLTPYFMTAQHCGITSSNAASLVTFWNFENSYCRPPGDPGSGGPGDGTLDQFNTGSTHRAAYGPSDVTLVELTNDPDPDWFVSYAGWDATGDDAEWAVGIHHPSTNEKRISFQWSPTTTTSYLGEAVPGDGTHVRIIDWDLGTTEPGSSGSPLFNQDHRVIGQLHGGYASCTSQTSDWYGKFSVSFAGGGSPDNSLKFWLDPDDTGTLVADTLSTMGMSVSPGNDVAHIGKVGGPFTNDPYEYTLTNNTNTDVDYAVSLTNDIGVLLNGDSSPVTGTLPAGGGEDTLTVSLDASVKNLPAGIYEEIIVFEDLTTGIVREITHTIEVGQTDFTTTPADDFASGGPLGGPFDATMTYTIESTRPTPVNVTVASSEPWISINGDASPYSVTLNGVGDSTDIIIGFSAAAENLPNGLHSGTVTFTNDDGDMGDTSRQVTLDVGRFVYYPGDVPQPIEDHTTTTSTIGVPDDYCIGDVEVDIDISHTYIGDLTIDLTSPTGTVVRLHNRTGGSSDDIVTRYADSGEDTTAPDGPGALEDFVLHNVQGTWTLTVHDHAGADQGTLNDWSLRIAALGEDCPDFELVHAFPFDENPGWSTDGLWAFGEPLGGGGQYGNPDPDSAHTGDSVYGYNLAGDYENNLSPQHLTTSAIDCSDLTGVRLGFMRWLNVETPTYDEASISISNDGQNWTTIWENGSQITDDSWTYHQYNISEIADNQPTVYIRWTIGPTDGSWQFSGWNIDDVEIWAFAEDDDCTGDIDGNGAVDGGDLLAMLSGWGDCAGCDADLNDDDVIDGADLLLLLSAWGACP